MIRAPIAALLLLALAASPASALLPVDRGIASPPPPAIEPAGPSETVPLDLTRFRPFLAMDEPLAPCGDAPVTIRALLCSQEAGDVRLSDHPAEDEAPVVDRDGAPLARAWGVETNLYFLVQRTAEIDGDPGAELLHLSQDGFLFATEPDQTDRWRWTPSRWARALEIGGNGPTVLVFTGPRFSPVTLATDRPLATGDVNQDGHEDVLVSLLVFPRVFGSNRTYAAYSEIVLIDGATGELLWHERVEGFARHMHLLPVNGDAVPDLVYAVENGPALEYLYGSQVGNASSPASRLVARDGQTRQELWSRDLGGPWSLASDLDAADLEGDGGTELVLFRIPGAIGADYTLDRPQLLSVLDPRTGTTRWERDVGRAIVYEVDAGVGGIYVRDVRLKIAASRDAVPDRSLLHAFDPRTGEVRWTRTWENALVWDHTVGDLRGGGPDEIALTALRIHPTGLFYEDAFVDLLDDHGTPVWRHRIPVGPYADADGRLWAQTIPLLLRVEASPGAGGAGLLAAVEYRLPSPHAGLLLFDAQAGETPVRQVDGDYSFLGLAPDRRGGFFATAFGGHVTRAHRGGADPLGAPLAYPLYAFLRTDLNGDGTVDGVAAGESGVVFAFDGSDPTRLLWRASCADARRASPVYDLPTGGQADGSRALFAVGRERICALGWDGAVRWSYDRPAERVHERYATGHLADLNGDGRLDLATSGTRAFALDGSSGRELWSFGAPRDNVVESLVAYPRAGERLIFDNAFGTLAAGDANGDAVVDFAVQFVADYPRQHANLALLDGRNGVPLWSVPIASPVLIPALWESTLIVDLDGDGRAEVVTAWLQNEDLPPPDEEIVVMTHQTTHVAAYDATTGIPLWQTGFPYPLILNGLRALPLRDGGHAVLVVDLLSGWALVSPRGDPEWVQYAHRADGSRGVQPWDARFVDADGDGDAEVAVSDFKSRIQLFEGGAFLEGTLLPMYTYRGYSAARLFSEAPPGDGEPIGFATFPYAAWVYKHSEAGIGIFGGLAAPRGAGFLTTEPAVGTQVDFAPAKRGLLPGPDVLVALAVLGVAVAAVRGRRPA